MNKIWTCILLSSLTVAIFTMPDIAITAMTKGANDAVKLGLTLVALYGLWLGLLNLCEKLGLTDRLSKLMQPLVRLIFGKSISKESQKYIATNISANLLGLGNAATPMGISAINSMQQSNQSKASMPMIMLVVISGTSLQLLPTTVIGMLVNHGSAFPTSFLLPCIVATISSTIIGIVMVKILSKIFNDNKINEDNLDTINNESALNNKNLKTQRTTKKGVVKNGT